MAVTTLPLPSISPWDTTIAGAPSLLNGRRYPGGGSVFGSTVFSMRHWRPGELFVGADHGVELRREYRRALRRRRMQRKKRRGYA